MSGRTLNFYVGRGGRLELGGDAYLLVLHPSYPLPPSLSRFQSQSVFLPVLLILILHLPKHTLVPCPRLLHPQPAHSPYLHPYSLPLSQSTLSTVPPPPALTDKKSKYTFSLASHKKCNEFFQCEFQIPLKSESSYNFYLFPERLLPVNHSLSSLSFF